MQKITAIIHTYNSEKYLRECISALNDIDEILICDMHSTDKTIQIATELGCRIIYHENVGFADPARNFAISQASNDWILVVDSDEIVSPEFISYIRESIEKPDCPDVFKVTFKAYYFGKFITHKYPDHQSRFFKKGFVEWGENVHNGSVSKGNIFKIPAERLDLGFKHYNYDSISDFVIKGNRYTTLELDNFLSGGKKATPFKLITRGFFGFFNNYFVKKAYKDGMHGFIISVLVGYYKFLAIAKLWEYEKDKV